MKNMKISLKMKGDVMSNQFLMLWFQKDSLDTIGLRTYGGGSKLQSPKPKSDIQSPKCAWVEGSPQKYQIFTPSPK